MLCVLAIDYTDNFSIEGFGFESRPDNFVSLNSLDQLL